MFLLLVPTIFLTALTVHASVSVNHKLRLGKIYFVGEDQFVKNGEFITLTGIRTSASPDPSSASHKLRVILLLEPGHPAMIHPDKSLPATADGADVSALFYQSDDNYVNATLSHQGYLDGFPNTNVLGGMLIAPERTGVFRLGWLEPSGLFVTLHSSVGGGTAALGPLQSVLEVTCDDDVFCNGHEAFIRGRCVPDASNPCYLSATDTCLQHRCDETTRTCASKSIGSEAGLDCAICGPVCQPKCDKGQKCGSGGCPICPTDAIGNPGGCVFDDTYCGVCNGAFVECVEGQCAFRELSVTPGSCSRPYRLFENTTIAGRVHTTVFHVNGNPILSDFQTVPPRGIQVRIDVPYVDNMEDATTAACQASGVQEHVFSFSISGAVGSGAQGVEISMISNVVDLGASSTEDRFNNGLIDTLLAIHDEDCEPLGPGAAAYTVCSDDATPPGNLASRVYTRLTPGNYRLVATFFTAQSGGPYMLAVKFTDGDQTCFPQCDGKFCGSDECTMYDVAAGRQIQTICGLEQYVGLSECNEDLQCIVGRCSNCDPNYVNGPDYVSSCGVNGACGYDQCNLACSKKEISTGELACSKGIKACDYNTNRCVSVSECDNFSPECKGEKNGRGDARFCGTDCVLHRTNQALPDLVPDSQEIIADSIIFNRRTFNTGTCAIIEGCLGVVTEDDTAAGSFQRTLMRFDTNVVNLGADFKPPPVNQAPQLFEYSACHGHNHFEGFAAFDLFDLENRVHVNDLELAIAGGKLAYCMEDSEPHFRNAATQCLGRSICDDQGIQYGWIDRYPNYLDCQWIVLDSLYAPGYAGPSSGWFVYKVCTNFGRSFAERTFNNNCRAFPVYLPPMSTIHTDDPVHYRDYIAAHPELCDDPVLDDLPYGVEYPSVCV